MRRSDEMMRRKAKIKGKEEQMLVLEQGNDMQETSLLSATTAYICSQRFSSCTTTQLSCVFSNFGFDRAQNLEIVASSACLMYNTRRQ
jgi:hypothetical protein